MKKMRRLIPAVAMLMVAAVMLSTASFAWFTMNEEVTASGMQIQAKADGSLLISQAPFSDANLGTPDVVINAAVKNLYPMAYNGTVNGATLALDGQDAGWYKPADNKVSNTVTGANTGDYAAVDSLAGYSYKEEFYIATAGEALDATTLKITLTAPVCPATGETHKAYAAAIYVVEKNADTWLDGADVTIIGQGAVAPSALLYVGESVDPAATETRNVVSLTDIDIPSVAGAVNGNEVGLKVIVHFYVDGALKSLTKTVGVNTGYTHVQATGKWNAETAYYAFTAAATPTSVDGYYVLTEGKYVPATGEVDANTTYFTRSTPVATDEIKGADAVPADWYVATEASIVQSEYTYVRSADIPSNGSTLKLAFSAPLAGN